MANNDEILDLKRQVEEISLELSELGERMNAQYTDMMILLQRIDGNLSEVNTTIENVEFAVGEVRQDIEESLEQDENEEHESPKKEQVVEIPSVAEGNKKMGFELYTEAKDTVLELKCASVPILQKTMHIGYSEAVRLIGELEEDGIIGPDTGDGPREVFET